MKFSLELIGARLPDLLRASIRAAMPVPLECAAGVTPGGAPDEWRPVQPGERWGQAGQTVLMRASFQVPEEWTDGSILANIRLADDADLSGPEALVYLNGAPYCGIDHYHHDVPLDGQVQPGERCDLRLEVYSSLIPDQHTMRGCSLWLVDRESEALVHDFRVLRDAALVMPDHSTDRARLVRALERAYRALDLRNPRDEAYRRSVGDARDILRAIVDGKSVPVTPTTIAVGHAHIDLAWLWPVAQTRRKGARTFSTALRLMERYPAFRFVVSQPALYEMVREDEPDLFGQIRQRIDEGRWEPTGASWVEMDCNLTGGEALIRQFLIGKRWFRQDLGVDPQVLWLPDVFGYSAALPQVLKGCEVEYFMTTKISWNEYNRLPYDTFRWQGIDGTQVLTHMVTAPITLEEQGELKMPQQFYTYNAKFTPYDVAGNWAAYRQQAINDEVLYLFGYGDGGGGPTPEMLETATRLEHLPGFMHVEQTSAEAFFDRLRERVWDDPDLPRWTGELYLEYHRGTYTSQGWIKRANRQSELLYREGELWGAVAGLSDVPARLERGWKDLLFHQFHDILPGSSIHQVYEDARRAYVEIQRAGKQIVDEAQATVAGEGTEALVVFNPSPFDRQDPVEVALEAGEEQVGFVDGDGAQLDVQPLESEHGGRVLIAAHAPPLGVARYARTRPRRTQEDVDLFIDRQTLENRWFRLELAEDGTIESLVDKRVNREVIARGERANRFIAFEDRPLNFDAWDIQIDYQDKPYPVDDLESMQVVETGPLRGGIRIERRYRNSTISQRMLLYRDVPRIDFVTRVDWHEHQTLLKVAFPVSVNSSRATFDIQWGNVERPTHWNTSWDWARFETCAHKWVDLSEGDYGVSLLNDCKYGHDIKDRTIRLTLIKSGVWPDPEADQGEHIFTYSLLPHPGDWRQGETVRHAYLLNMPQSARSASSEGYPGRASFVRTDRPGLVIETVKPAEDGDGVVVRVYDAHNSRGPCRLEFDREIVSAETVNMLEASAGPVEYEGRELRFDVRPYGIHSFRVRLEARS